MTYPIDIEIQGLLQDVSETAGEVLAGLLDGDLEITEDNVTTWRRALPTLYGALELIVALKSHTAQSPSPLASEHATYDHNWARAIDAAFERS